MPFLTCRATYLTSLSRISLLFFHRVKEVSCYQYHFKDYDALYIFLNFVGRVLF